MKSALVDFGRHNRSLLRQIVLLFKLRWRHITDGLRELVYQEELCNLELDLSMNLNSNSILTHQRPSP